MFILPSAGGHMELWAYTWMYLTLSESLHPVPAAVSSAYTPLTCLTGLTHYQDHVASSVL